MLDVLCCKTLPSGSIPSASRCYMHSAVYSFVLSSRNVNSTVPPYTYPMVLMLVT